VRFSSLPDEVVYFLITIIFFVGINTSLLNLRIEIYNNNWGEEYSEFLLTSAIGIGLFMPFSHENYLYSYYSFYVFVVFYANRFLISLYIDKTTKEKYINGHTAAASLFMFLIFNFFLLLLTLEILFVELPEISIFIMFPTFFLLLILIFFFAILYPDHDFYYRE
jgi:hypothetical protein